MARDASGIELRNDPAALAPERLLVFEVRASISSFISAIRGISGLEFIDEEELEQDDQDKNPTLYLLVPDARALTQISSLWKRWVRGEQLDGHAPWRNVFETLRDVRPWGPNDRVNDADRETLIEEISFLAGDAKIRLEIELVYRQGETSALEAETALINQIRSVGGRIIDRSRISDISYHAVLAEVPVSAVQAIIARDPSSIAGLDPVMYVRPQSILSPLETSDKESSDETVAANSNLREPILALLDGVPIAQHPVLAGALIVDDQFDLEPQTQVAERVHGTAMASLIVQGDRNLREAKLQRYIHVVPVLNNDEFPKDKLVIDVIYRAVKAMRDGEGTAPNVLIVNMSLGNPRRPFQGMMSPWARLVDRLAYEYGILFVVSSGNYPGQFSIPGYNTATEFRNANNADRASATLTAISSLMAERKIISPAETVNGLTIGAANIDAVTNDNRNTASGTRPYTDLIIANPSSALGNGPSNCVKPDILMPGACEHLTTIVSGDGLTVKPSGGHRAHGIKVACPPSSNGLVSEHYTCGTSAAAALASRACHQIHDALEAAYGVTFLSLPHAQRAVLLKALLAHTAAWPDAAADLIRNVVGPANPQQHVRQKDNIRRFLGYGVGNPELAVSCAGDRATFWTTGTLASEKNVIVQVPVPVCLNGKSLPHMMSATLAWFSPVLPGRQLYRAVRLTLEANSDLEATLRVNASSVQPDANQVKKGTLLSRRWEGDGSPVVSANQTIDLRIQREIDQGSAMDESVPFGLAVTLAMPGILDIYEEVRSRTMVQQPTRA